MTLLNFLFKDRGADKEEAELEVNAESTVAAQTLTAPGDAFEQAMEDVANGEPDLDTIRHELEEIAKIIIPSSPWGMSRR